MEKNGNTCALLVGIRLVQSLWKTIIKFLKKLNIDLAHHLAILHLAMHPKEMKTEYRRDMSMPMFTAALFTVAKIRKPPISVHQ